MQIKTIDLFAGIGGIRIGIEKAAKQKNFEYKNVFTSEIDKHCIETYKTNFKD
jgi:DNA (cytosine-5)-methyltransferase 1